MNEEKIPYEVRSMARNALEDEVVNLRRINETLKRRIDKLIENQCEDCNEQWSMVIA